MTTMSAIDASMLTPPPQDPLRHMPRDPGPLDGPFGGPFGGPFDPPIERSPDAPKTDDDITVEEWGLCGDVMGVSVDAGDGDDDIRLVVNRDGTSDLWVNGEHKGQFTKEQTEKLTIRTGEGSDKVTIEDNRSFQDDRLPTVENNGKQGTDSVEVRYPGYEAAKFPLEPGQRSA